MHCGLKEIKMEHDQWSVDWWKRDETWTIKSELKKMRWNMDNEIINNVTIVNIQLPWLFMVPFATMVLLFLFLLCKLCSLQK